MRATRYVRVPNPRGERTREKGHLSAMLYWREFEGQMGSANSVNTSASGAVKALDNRQFLCIIREEIRKTLAPRPTCRKARAGLFFLGDSDAA